ncbi:MAG TPA: FtsX-like permease family protein [Verrucomicrobiae bacterium]|nr:FtsX-like permease family protein [Verrucomicrobiae bacterium]
MTLIGLILRELRHHWVNALLGTLGLVIAVALLVAVSMTTAAAERETRRVMRDLGFNLRIIPRATDMDYFWTHGIADQTMPEDAVKRLAEQHGVFLSFNHLTPALEGRIEVAGRPTLLTGIGDTIVGGGKQPMGFRIKPGQVFLGRSIADRLEAKRGGTIRLGEREFTVERILGESGTEEDVRIYGALADVQAVLGQPGRINEIKAIDCLCLTADQDPLSQLRAVIDEVLPEARVLQLTAMADARARQRQMAERYARFAVPLVLLVGAGWLGLLTWLNVRERRAEIGLWRALGHGSARIAGLLLGKALVLGAIGAAIGYGLGTWIALSAGPDMFQVTAKSLRADPTLLLWAILLTPAFAALASLLPTMLAVGQEPARTLRAD